MLATSVETVRAFSQMLTSSTIFAISYVRDHDIPICLRAFADNIIFRPTFRVVRGTLFRSALA